MVEFSVIFSIFDKQIMVFLYVLARSKLRPLDRLTNGRSFDKVDCIITSFGLHLKKRQHSGCSNCYKYALK